MYLALCMVVGEGMNATDHISVDKGVYGGFQLEIQLTKKK
jgi:hypothetical protein